MSLKNKRNIDNLHNKRIGPLLAKLAIPATIGMLANSLYNVVDTIFIGRGIGTLAIAGVGIVFPIQMIVMASAQLVGLGSASMISRRLGEKDYEGASRVTANSFMAVTILGLVITAIALIFPDAILRLFGVTPNIYPYAREYLSTITLGFVFFPFLVSTNNLIRAEGDAKNSMIIMLLATGLNIVLDPIFIFVFGLGIRGAAYATVISQFAGFLYALIYYVRGKSCLHIKLSHFKIRWSIIKEITSLGFASFIRQVSGSVLMIIVNNSLKIYGGDIAIAAFSVINRIAMFVTMPLFGIVAAVQPIVGYNYGAKNMSRVKEALKVSIFTTMVIGGFFFAVLLAFPGPILRVFSNDQALLSLAANPLRILMLLFPLIGFQVIGAGFFQSIGKANPSIILSMSRQILFLIPLILLLPLAMGISGIWFSFPIADFLAILLTGFFLLRELRLMEKRTEIKPACQES
jgi:putative MATE family efflux protein